MLQLFTSLKNFYVRAERYRVRGALVLATSLLLTISPFAQALELEAGTLNRTVGDAFPTSTRIDFVPEAAGENTISVAWSGSSKVRFSLAELTPNGATSVFFVTPTATSNPQVWTGDLDTSKTYSLLVWVVFGEVDYVATLDAANDPGNGPLTTIIEGTLDSTKATAPRWVPLELVPLVQGDHTVTISWANSATADVRFRVVNNTSGVNSSTFQGSNPGTWTGSLDLNDDVFIGLWSTNGITDYTATIEATGTAIPLAIDSQPADVIVTENDSATFSVSASGNGPLSYQWFSTAPTPNAATVNPAVAISGATSATLNIASTTLADDASRYSVDVTDSSGTLRSDAALLTVQATPIVITGQPQSITVTEGDEATFTVTTSGGGNVTYQWFADGTAITGATTNTLVLASVSLAQDSIEYAVTATDGNTSQDSNAASLTVEPLVIDPVTVATISSGTLDSTTNTAPRWVRLDFEPLIQGDHTIRVSWDNSAGSNVRFRVNASSGPFSSAIVQGSNPGIWTGSLNANEDYFLALWSANGLADYSATIEATVPLAIDSDPVDVNITEGVDAVFLANASGSGTLSYQWLANGSPIVGATQDTLTVYNTTLADSNTEYSVQVSNGAQTLTSAPATLTVNAPISLGLFSGEADGGTWILEGPAPTLDFKHNAASDAWGQELLRVGDVLLVGGDFDGIRRGRGLSVTYQPFLAALDAVTGLPVPFNVPAEIDSVVRALALSPNGEQIYVGGDFGFVALDVVTGNLEFSVDVTGGSGEFTAGQDATDGGIPTDGRIFDIAVTDSLINPQVYIGGDFTRIDGAFRGNIARLSPNGQLDSSFTANMSGGFNNGRSAPVQAIAVPPSTAPLQDIVYVGGTFFNAQGVSGVPTFPVYQSTGNSAVSMLALSTTDGGTAYDYRYAIDVGTNPKSLKPHDIAVTKDGIVIVAWGGPNFLTFHEPVGDVIPNEPLLHYIGKGDIQSLQVVGDHLFVGHHGEFFRAVPGHPNHGSVLPAEAIPDTTDPDNVFPYKFHSFRLDDPDFPLEQAWRINGKFGIWGIAAAEDSVWIAGDISLAGTNGRTVDGLARFSALP